MQFCAKPLVGGALSAVIAGAGGGEMVCADGKFVLTLRAVSF